MEGPVTPKRAIALLAALSCAWPGPAAASEPSPPAGTHVMAMPAMPAPASTRRVFPEPRRAKAKPRPAAKARAMAMPADPGCNPPRRMAGSACPPITCPLTAEDRQVAKTAWAYFERNIQPKTGLCNATDGYPSTTMWDEASALYATFCAHRLGLIDNRRYDELVTRALATLATLPLLEGELPNKAYDTREARMVDYSNKPTDVGIGWSAIDLGRLTTALSAIRGCDAAHRDQADRVLLSWRWNRLIGANRELYGAVRLPDGKLQLVQEGRLGYQEYSHRAFEHLGVAKLASPPVKYARLYGLDIPYDARDPVKFGAHTYVVSEPYILGAVELGLTPQLTDWARRVYTVQQRRYEATGVPTAVSEDHLDRAPYFVYNTVFTDGYPWRCITDKGDDATPYKSLSTKAAYGWATLYNEPYANLLWNEVRQGLDPKGGFYTGRYERALGYNKVLTANTNGIILECLLYSKTRRPILAPVTGAGPWERYRATVADERGLPGGRKLPALPGRARGTPSAAERADAEQAWRYFEANTDPASGLVPARHGASTVDMASLGDTLMAIAGAERLGLISADEGLARSRKVLETIETWPLAEQTAPAMLYTLNGRFAGYDGAPRDRALGWDAFELGRFLNGLGAAVIAHPQLYAGAKALVASWQLDQVVKDGRLYKGVVDQNRLNIFMQSRVGAEQYAALGFALWGHKAALALDGGHERGYHDVSGVEVPIDRRGQGLTTSGPWLMAVLEHPSAGRLSAEAPYLYAAQQARAAELGRPVSADGGPADRGPGRITDVLVGQEGREWEAFGPDNKAYPGLRGFSTGAAFGWSALYRTPYAETLRKTAEGLSAPEGGFYRGRYDMGEVNHVADAHTSALALEAIAYHQGGPLLSGWEAAKKAGEALPPPSPRPVPVKSTVPTSAVPTAAPAPLPAPAGRPGWVPLSEQWSGNVGVTVPLRFNPPQATGAGTSRANVGQVPYQAYAQATLNWNPYSYFFGRLTALRYLDPTQQQPWNPDFTYAFGYNDWHPGTPSLTFEHYGGNRWPGRGPGASFTEGTLSLGQKFPELGWWPTLLGQPNGLVSLSWTPRFTDAGGGYQSDKFAAHMRLGYRLFQIVDLWITPNLYFGGKQQPWDPDFTYGFGLADWKPWSLSINYANYAGNRWPWRQGGTATGGLLDGSITMSGSWRL